MATQASRDELEAMSEAHAEGLHAEAWREFCPECEAGGHAARVAADRRAEATQAWWEQLTESRGR